MIKIVTLCLLLTNFCFAESRTFELSSSSFDDGELMPMKQVSNHAGCKGKNDSPALEWTDGPVGTKSYAITVYDKDAQVGKAWWHWIVFNIPASVTSLKESVAALPKQVIQGKNDFGESRYEGACPPVGGRVHHYIFTVYALNVEKVPFNSDISGAVAELQFKRNMLAKATVTATYSR